MLYLFSFVFNLIFYMYFSRRVMFFYVLLHNRPGYYPSCDVCFGNSMEDSTSSNIWVLEQTSSESAKKKTFSALTILIGSSKDSNRNFFWTWFGGQGKCSVICIHFREIAEDLLATKTIIRTLVEQSSLKTSRNGGVFRGGAGLIFGHETDAALKTRILYQEMK